MGIRPLEFITVIVHGGRGRRGQIGNLLLLLLGGVAPNGGQHALGQLVLPVGQLVVLPLVLPLVAVQLARGVEDVVAVAPDAVDVVDGLGEPAVVMATWILFHKLLEAVLVELFVLHMEILVLLHVSLVFEGELAAGAIAMKVRGFLASKWAIVSIAVLAASEPHETLPLDGIVLPVVVEVHLDIRG